MFRHAPCLLLALVVLCALSGAQSTAGADTPPAAAVLCADLPGADPALAKTLTAELTAAGYSVVDLDAEALCDPGRLTSGAIDLLVLPDAGRLPARSTESIHAFLSQGGDCLALNTPAWQERLLYLDGQWTTSESFRRQHAGDLPDHMLFDFSEDSLAGWYRTAFRWEIPVRHETVADGPGPGQRALHVSISALDNWDTFASPPLDKAFPEGHTLTVFSAKGGPSTTQLAVEWQERDGSRWIAVAPLSHEWQQYRLAPEDFRFWESVPARANSTFNPRDAVRMTVGLAFSHTGHAGGEHEYWVGPFGTAAAGSADSQVIEETAPPKLDTLSPTYKLFNSSDVGRLVAAPDQLVVPEGRFTVPRTVRSPHPRPQAGGFDKGRVWRWMPILEARTDGGAWRGTPVTLLCHADGPYKGGMWASFGIGDGDWYHTEEALQVLRRVAIRMADGVFLIDGGANSYTYFEGQTMRLGVRAVNLSKTRQRALTARVVLTNPDTGEPVHTTREWPLELEPGETVSVSETWQPKEWPRQGFKVMAELLRDGEVIDVAAHETHVWRPKPEKEFVTVSDGDFVLDGQRWRPHGVNYMPSSGIGTQDGDYFEHWIGARAYDPNVIQRDLEHCKDLGLNAVSIFIYRESMEAQNLLDLLRRLDALDMKANLSLRPGTPMNFRWQEMRELLEYYRLSENDTVFALDLAWEPLFRLEEREPWNDAWEQWVIERYGSIENAEAEWGVPLPRDDAGKPANFAFKMLDEDGPWNKMTAAYRRFLDTLLYEKYSAARRLVRTVDPYHLVSFRMTVAGDPTCRWNEAVPYDFAYLAGAVDILEPEAYGRIGDWERVKPGWFTYEYGRWANAALPVMWAEAGVHAWDLGRMESSPELLEYQAEFYGRMYRMFIGTGSDGIFWWWYPGGFRANENSDYGIINPDGSDRPVSKVIREQAAALIEGPSAPSIDTWLEIDRDKHADGLRGVYDEAKEAFWDAIDNGHVPGLKTAGSDTDSADCPLVAVGNVPCNGTNPPKYLDGFFDVVQVQDAGGRWIDVGRGDKVEVAGTGPIRARVTVTNLGEAAWLAQADAPAGVGVVRVVAHGGEIVATPVPRRIGLFETVEFDMDLTPGGVERVTTVTLTFEAVGRSPFGPKFPIVLAPRLRE